MLLRYCMSDYEMVPVAPIITGITFTFTMHIRLVSIIIIIIIIITLQTLPKTLGHNSIRKLHFQANVDYIFSQSVRILVLICTTTYSFYTLES
jgi:hypothetical protein